jgi:tetratricopeptide (TPR) repeat protein
MPRDWASAQSSIGNALVQQGVRTGGSEGSVLLAGAVIAYHAALEVYSKEHSPEDWGLTHNNLAGALMYQGRRATGRQATDLLTQAEAAYHAALKVYTKEATPQRWVMIQYNLGLLYEHTKQWELAIQHFESIRSFAPEYAEMRIKAIRNKMK